MIQGRGQLRSSLWGSLWSVRTEGSTQLSRAGTLWRVTLSLWPTGIQLLCRDPVRGPAAALDYHAPPRQQTTVNYLLTALNHYTFYSLVWKHTSFKVGNILIAIKHNDLSSFSGVDVNPTEFSCCKRHAKRFNYAVILYFIFCSKFYECQLKCPSCSFKIDLKLSLPLPHP
jgi:hypothetical protein